MEKTLILYPKVGMSIHLSEDKEEKCVTIKIGEQYTQLYKDELEELIEELDRISGNIN